MTNDQVVQYGDSAASARAIHGALSTGFIDYKDEMNIAMKTAYQVSMNHTVPLIFTVRGHRLIDLNPSDPQSLVYSEL